MVKRDIISNPQPDQPDEVRLAEIAYHKKFNRWAAVFGSVIFIFFAVFHFRLEHYFQSFIFVLLFVNAVGAVLLGYRIKGIDNLVRLKRVTTAIAFIFIATSLIAGVLSDDIYIYFPWIFAYPIAIMFMFGKRIGLFGMVTFSVVITAAVVMAELPPWDDFNTGILKLNSVLTLFALLGVAFFSEKARERIQADLVSAQNKYKAAEQRQREINREIKQEVTLRKQSEKALAQSEMRYRTLFEESPVSVWEEDWSLLKQYIDKHADDIKGAFSSYFSNHPDAFDAIQKLVYVNTVNRATLKLYEADSQETLQKNLFRILPENFLENYVEKITALSLSGHYDAEVKARTINGQQLHLLISSTIPAGFEDSWERIYTTVFDNTERVLMEAEKHRVLQQLHSARQIQAIATLAGGIAHEFNNSLAVIYGNLDLLEIYLREEKKILELVAPLKKSTEKIGQLTEQLLAYARGGKYQPKQFSINELIQSLLAEEKMTPVPSVRVATEFASDVCLVRGDTTQIKMVMQAVISNAFESIDGDGDVIIETRNQIFEKGEMISTLDIAPGSYAIITVQDNGTGMDSETTQRIFEPFFTTKVFGRGLGMAAAFGIVKNHDGMITVKSKPDHGTRVKIYLPENT